MIKFSILLKELSSLFRGRTYYHGTGSWDKAQLILKQGIQPNKVSQWTNSSLVPRSDRIYITSKLTKALDFAQFNYYAPENESELKEMISDFKSLYGFVFVISGRKLYQIEPDEDIVAGILNHFIAKEQNVDAVGFYDVEKDFGTFSGDIDKFEWVAERTAQLFPNEYKEISERIFIDPHDDSNGMETSGTILISLSRKLVDHLSDDEKQKLLDASQSFAHYGPIMPDKCWKFDNRKVARYLMSLANDLIAKGVDFPEYERTHIDEIFFAVAKRIK